MAFKNQVVLALCSLCFSFNLHASQIQYSVTNISANVWQYEYTLTNDTLGSDIEEFSVFFDINEYSNLTAALTPANWDPLVLQPDAGIPDDGLYDALALSSGIAPGGSLGGFVVQFEYLGTGTPGSQQFTIVDKNSFATLDSGLTTLVVVPLPPALWLFVSSLLFGGFLARSNSKSAER